MLTQEEAEPPAEREVGPEVAGLSRGHEQCWVFQAPLDLSLLPLAPPPPPQKKLTTSDGFPP